MKKPSGFKQSYDLAWSDHQRQMETYGKERDQMFRYIVCGVIVQVGAMGASPRCDR
jgi:hypothetical protein